MKQETLHTLLFCTALFLCGTQSLAAENPQQTEQELAGSTPVSEPASESDTRQIEQINVIGERSLLTMRNEIIREEDTLYRMFNDLNSNDKFDIFCRKQSNTHSRIPKRSCEPQFLTNQRQQSSRHSISEMRQAFSDEGVNLAILQNGLDLLEPEGELKQQLAGDYEDMNEEIFRIAMENPDYLAVLQKIAQLQAVYTAARKEKFGPD